MAARNLPAGCAAIFFPSVLRAGGSARMELRARPDAPADPQHDLAVEGASPRWVATRDVTVTVEPRPIATVNALTLALVIIVVAAAALLAAARRRRGKGA